jgi:D-glycero-alpha-D-manno-heptose 1-phosphate guanylyltransferase
MAPVAGKPFLGWIIGRLLEHGITRVILSLGYRHEAITAYLESAFPDLDFEFCIEEEPLGTGGGIRLAMEKARTAHPTVVNGDTFFDVDLKSMTDLHLREKAHCTLALKPLKDFDRYGVVTTDANGRVNGFQEKKHYTEGMINGGVYMIDRVRFLEEVLPRKFSFEKDYLEVFTASRLFYGLPQNGYFIDIGIPEDYQRAQVEIPKELKL